MTLPVHTHAVLAQPAGEATLADKLKTLKNKGEMVAFVNAHLKGKPLALHELVRQNPQAGDFADERGCTLLACIAELGECELAEILLGAGADVNAQDTTGWSPLYRASGLQSPDMMRLLVSKGARVDIVNQDGSAPLHRAAARGSAEAVACLLELRADPSLVNCVGTALHYAAKGGHAAVVDLLLPALDGRRPAAPASTLALEPTPYGLARDGGHKAIALKIAAAEGDALWHLPTGSPLFQAAQRGDWSGGSEKDDAGFTLLHYAAFLGNGAAVDQLLDAVPQQVDAKDAKGRTPLDHAARCGNRAAAERLMERGASLRNQDAQGYFPLYWAVHFNKGESLELVRSMLQRDRSLAELTDKFGWTSLHKAAEVRNVEMCRLLLGVAPVNIVNAVSGGGETPLHRAAMSGSEDVVRILLDAGADKTIKNGQGKVPLDFATKEAVRALL